MAATFLPIIAQKGIDVLIPSFPLPPELASLCLLGKFSGGYDNVCRKPFLKLVLVLRWNAALTNMAFSFSMASATPPSPSSRKHFVIQVISLPTCSLPRQPVTLHATSTPHSAASLPTRSSPCCPPLTLRAAPTRIPPPLPHTPSTPSPAPPPHINFCCRDRPRKIIWTLPSNPGDKDWDGQETRKDNESMLQGLN